MNKEIEKELIQYIDQELLGGNPPVPISANTDLLGSGLIESMGIMMLIQHIEESNSIKIPVEDMVIENFMSVSCILDYLKNSHS